MREKREKSEAETRVKRSITGGEHLCKRDVTVKTQGDSQRRENIESIKKK